MGRLSIVLGLTAAIIVLLLAGAAFAGYRYEQSKASQVLPGVRIAGVEVGGMTRPQAERALSDLAGRILDRPITVRSGGEAWQVTPREMGTTVDVKAAIDEAFHLADSYSWPTRVVHRLFNRPVERQIELAVHHDRSKAASFVARVAAAVHRDPRDAALDFEDGHLVVQHSEIGRAIKTGPATTALMGAIRSRDRSQVSFRPQALDPSVTEEDLGHTIIVRLSQLRLYLYDGLSLVKTYPVAAGQLGRYDTPQGHWEIINKRINPTWVNPAKDSWGAGEPDFIPPGPDNPLGTRALDLNAPGIRIHGTPADSSIGTYASHGCIRMHIPDSEDLFGRVDIGTPVIVAW